MTRLIGYFAFAALQNRFAADSFFFVAQFYSFPAIPRFPFSIGSLSLWNSHSARHKRVQDVTDRPPLAVVGLFLLDKHMLLNWRGSLHKFTLVEAVFRSLL